MNLVINAIESMQQGGRLHISTSNIYVDKPEVLHEILEEGEYVCVKIADTGDGIAKEDIDKIFEPFYTNKVLGRSGTGLGLAIVWGTVKDHNGYIDVQSEVAKGTTFTLYFPATRENIASARMPLELQKYSGNGESILIVDDVKLQREICTSILERLGYKVASVPSGEDAVEYIRNTSVDLIVLDMIITGGIDGLETYEKIVAIRPDQKAVVVSGFAQSERVKKAMALGAGAYIKKPYSMEKLGVAVKSELVRKS